jgi:hypothetical protein
LPPIRFRHLGRQQSGHSTSSGILNLPLLSPKRKNTEPDQLVWLLSGDPVLAIENYNGLIEAGQAQALINKAVKSGFGGLCDEYVARGFDGTFSTTSVCIGNEIKTVADDAPSNAPVWLRRLGTEIEALDAVQDLIGPKENQHIPDKR